MTFCLVTDRFSPHEMPLAARMVELLGVDSFHYIVSQKTEVERTALGWMVAEYPWCVVIEQSNEALARATCLIKEADVVLFGNRTHSLIPWRVKYGKLTFYGSERWLKPPVGWFRLCHPKFLKCVFSFRKLLQSDSFYYLAQGVYALDDMRRLTHAHAKIRLFGYFVEPSTPVPIPKRRQGPLRVLWVGRMLKLKRVDTVIDAVRILHKKGRAIQLTLVGMGPEETRLRALSSSIEGDEMGGGGKGRPRGDPQLSVPDRVAPTIAFLPPVPIQGVRDLMRAADVYVFPSNGYEGWGVVVNEAMLEGCAVVAAKETGAAASMIRHGENGLLVRSGDAGEVAGALERLEADEAFRWKMAKEGQATVLNEWTPAVAAERLIQFSKDLLARREPSRWDRGPLCDIPETV